MKRYFFPILILFFLGCLPARAADLGERVNFNVDSTYDYEGRSQLAASLRKIGSHIYFYVEDKHWNSLGASDRSALLNDLNKLADEFDKTIYPKERAVFGSEWNPGIDNDSRITVLVLKLVDKAGGYFNTFDEYPKSKVPSSNEREMFYLNVSTVSESQSKSYLAHEFQHLISFYQKNKLHGLGEDVWLNEARSEYAPTLCGYNYPYAGSYLADRVDAFLDTPSDSLTEWKNEIPDYGAVSLFLHYLVGRYGTDILTRMTLNNKVGIASIEQAIKDLGHNQSFGDVFADWSMANYVNDCQLGSDNQYCYNERNLTYERLHTDYSASYSGFPNLIVSRSSTIKDWSARWYQFRQGTAQATNKDTLKLEFSGLDSRSDFKVPYIIVGPNDETTISSISLENQTGVVYVPNFSSLAKSLIIAPFNQYKKNGFGKDEPSTAFSFTASSVAVQAPIITNLSPGSGPAEGGFEITVQGGNLTNTQKITFAGLEISDFDVVNKETIRFTAPAHGQGAVDIAVNTSAGQGVLNDAFTYVGSGGYPDGSLLRAVGDYKVYIIKGGYKRWIQTAELFNMYGHLKWEDVIEVNPEELAGYAESSLIRAWGDTRVYEIDSQGVKHWLNMSAAQFTSSGRAWEAIYIVNGFERDYYQSGEHILN